MKIKGFIQRVISLRSIDRLLPVLFVVSLALISFIAGAYVAEFDVPWYQSSLKLSFQGLRAHEEER